MTFNRRERRGEWFCVITYKGDDRKRHEKWIPLGIKAKGDVLREVNSLIAKIAEPGAFDLSDREKTNDTLRSLGLGVFNANWQIEKDETMVAPDCSRKAVSQNYDFLISDRMASDDILKALTEIKHGRRILFGDYMAVWYNIHKTEIQPNSTGSLRSQIFFRIRPWFNERNITLKGIGPEDIEAFYRDMSASGKRTTNTIRHYHGTIRCALQYAFKKGYVVNNAADRASKPKKNSFKGSFYDKEELERLFRATKGTNLEIPIHMASLYGLRREEVLGLRWDAIDFQYRTMTIRKTATEAMVDGEMRLLLKDATKNSSSWRTMPLAEETLNMLLHAKTRQEKCKKLFGNRYNSTFDGYVCVFENGDLMRPNWITSTFHQFLRDNGFRSIRFHDLRHSCATLLRHEGVPMEDISKWLGHSNITTTEQVYAHYDEAKKADTLKTLTSVLSKDNEKDK